jgi:hypothetical protein
VGVPVPEVLLVETLAIGGQPREVMVQRRVPGRALGEIEHTLAPEQRAAVWRQAGVALGAIHSIRVGGFYKRHPDGGWDFPDWQSISEQAIVDRTSEQPLLIQAGLRIDEVDRLLQMLVEGQALFADEQPVLCHADFLPGHLFFDGDLTLTGVIDFGEFQGGAPILDFATISMDCPDVDLAWLQGGYGSPQLFDGTFPARLQATKLGLQLGYLAHFVRQGNVQEVGLLVADLREVLKDKKTGGRSQESECWNSIVTTDFCLLDGANVCQCCHADMRFRTPIRFTTARTCASPSSLASSRRTPS